MVKETSSGIKDEHLSLSYVTCGVCGPGQVLPILCAQHPHQVNGNDIWLLPVVRVNRGNPRKAFSLVLDKWGLLWALLQSRHSPAKSWVRDPRGAEGMKGSGARECHSDWAPASPGAVEQESEVQGQRWQQGSPQAASVQSRVSLTPLPPAPRPCPLDHLLRVRGLCPKSFPPSQPV